MMNRLLIASAILLFTAGCSKENYLYVQKATPNTKQTFKVKEMQGTNAVDVLWVIDNSGSMDSYQQEVIDNAKDFMQDFIKQKFSWKMGIISTDESELPYGGFSNNYPIDSTVADPLDVFNRTVARLGTYGSGNEETFTPILNAFTRDPYFLRANTPLAVIMVTDAPEQSRINAKDFISRLKLIIGDRLLYTYGVFAAGDFGCNTDDDDWNYKNSPYETFINSANVSQTFPLCKDFAQSLSSITKDIVTRVSHSAIYLTGRPDLSTLRVLYQGEELPAGPTEKGGYWVYNYRMNAVVFNNLDFAINDTDSVQVLFEEQRD